MQQLPSQRFPEVRRYFLVAVLVALPVYSFSVLYTKTILPKAEEQAALAATFFFLAGMYIGRYLAQLWTVRPVSWSLLASLAAGVVVCLVWIFVHAEFQQPNRLFLNLLLFFVPLFIMSIGIGLLVKLARITLQRQLQEANARAEQSQSELHLLQSQMSPHFLFNTLNNLYGLSLAQPEKVPPLLLQLSELLRYSVYDTKELFVALSEEVAYLNNYIAFEKIRVGDRLTLTTDLEDLRHSPLKIAPMLLIVFVENAFKHSKNTTDHKIAITITLKTWGNSILFSVKNSQGAAPDANSSLEKNRGLGLANVRKRLALLYPQAHDLVLQDATDYFLVQLQLKVQ